MITLATLAQATQQQVFDQVVKHMLGQNAQSVNDDGECLYRGPNGLKCAAGCLISESEYQARMDVDENGTDWYDLIEAGLVPKDHSTLIRHLQNIHDRYTPDIWYDRLTRAAAAFELEMPSLNQV